MTRVAVQMIRDRGANFRGERVLFELDLAKRLVSEGTCVLLDPLGNPIVPSVGAVEPSADSSHGAGATGPEAGRGKSKKSKDKQRSSTDVNPFEIDGLDPKTIAALAEAGIQTPDDLRAYVASGKLLSDLPAIGVAGEKDLLDLYDATVE
jgi:hypothetical protein